MPPQDPYNPLVRRYFVSPVHAGELQGTYSLELTAEADDGKAIFLRLAAGIDTGTVRELRFQALACPHLIAASEMFCGQFEGRPIAALQDFEVDEVMRVLQVPLNKTGRILLLEDAILSLRQKTGDETQT